MMMLCGVVQVNRLKGTCKNGVLVTIRVQTVTGSAGTYRVVITRMEMA